MEGMRTTRQTAQTAHTDQAAQAPRQSLSEIQPGRYTIDPAASVVTFRTRHLFGLGRAHGTFAIRGGAVEITGVPGEARCYAEIDAASFQTCNPQRDASVRSPRLLDTSRHPVITFAADRLDGTGLAGQLTVRGVTCPAVIAAELTGAGPGGFTARGTLRVDRTGFGVTAYRGLAARWLDLTVEVRCAAN
jgi:polyisoprenoid-binding protein YceI